MSRVVDKLNIKLADRALSRKLAEAGLTTPKKIKAATDRQLKSIQGVGDAAVQSIRDRIG
jgi:NAD-dependent DNA ligase